MPNAVVTEAAVPSHSKRFMWLTPDRVLYVGMLGMPAVRTMGSVTVYMAEQGTMRVRINGGAWQTGSMAVVQPYVPHQVATDAQLVHVLKIEAETVDPSALPYPLAACGAVGELAFVQHVRDIVREMRGKGRDLNLNSLDFDTLFFGAPLALRSMDRRIQDVIDGIKRDPSVMAAAQNCAQSVHLSFSRFLHLFKEDVGVPFRSFRTWKRARSLLHYVNRNANLAHVALDIGYPDSTHFSHSIRQIYGLRPKDIFAGSRRLAIYEPVQHAT